MMVLYTRHAVSLKKELEGIGSLSETKNTRRIY